MLKKRLILLILLMLVPAVFASEVFDSKSVELSSRISSTLELRGTGSATYVKAWLNFFPREDVFQKVLSLKTSPESEEGNNALLFDWNNPQKSLQYSVDSRVKIEERLVKVTKKVPFPVLNLPDEIVPYTEPSDNIDSENPSIIALANQLAEGEEDLSVVVFKVASWVRDNINYSLNTLTAEVSQKASWVLSNRYGVCDEITTLSIALLRSLGIPAKFVSGLAFTNWNGINDFGAHGWMEVYFPGFGWVSYDVTYGELMFADASHLKLNENIDSKVSSVSFEWKGRDIDLKTNDLAFETDIIDFSPRESPFELAVRAVKPEIRFGSYNLIEASVTNKEPYYTASDISLIKTEKVGSVSADRIHFLLKPKEKKAFYFILKLDESLDSDYFYTLPVVVYTRDNTTASADFIGSSTGPYYSYEYTNEIVEQHIEQEQKTYSSKVFLNCFAVPEVLLSTQSNIYCAVKNGGNVLLEGLNVCLADKCSLISLGISQVENISFSITPNETGKREFEIHAKNDDVSVAENVIIDVLDSPKLSIDSVNFPEDLRFRQAFELGFQINQESYAAPHGDISIKVRHEKSRTLWKISNFNKAQMFTVKINTADFSSVNEEFEVTLSYNDKFSNTFTAEKSFTLSLSGVSFFQKIQLFLNKLLG